MCGAQQLSNVKSLFGAAVISGIDSMDCHCVESASSGVFSSSTGLRHISSRWPVNFKTTKNKPAVLKLFHECVGPEELRMLFGREGGRTYYSTVDLTASHSANAVVRNAASIQDAYCRMPLLTTPSVPCADFGFHAEEAPLIPCSRHTLASHIDSTQAPFFPCTWRGSIEGWTLSI